MFYASRLTFHLARNSYHKSTFSYVANTYNLRCPLISKGRRLVENLSYKKLMELESHS